MMANHAAQADPNMAMMRNDENAVMNHRKSLTTGSKTPAVTKPAAAGTKTPAATKTRRAFGDISNRKNAATAQSNKQSITLGKTPGANTTLKLAPMTKKTPFQNTNTNRRVNFNLPSESQQAKPVQIQAGAVTTTAAPKPVNLDVSDVDDIEQPAGRLWFQQQAMLDAKDADDLSLEGAATMVQDLEAMLDQRHELKVEMEVEDFERHLSQEDDHPPFANVFLPDGKSTYCCVWLPDWE
jgi:hypothetical protein